LTLAPRAGAAALAVGNTGTAALAAATIDRVGGARICLTNVKEYWTNERLGSPVVVFRCGAARYACAERKMVAFCDLVNLGEAYPRPGPFGSQVAKVVPRGKHGRPNPELESIPQEAAPPLLEEYRKYLLPKPVKGKIVRTAGWSHEARPGAGWIEGTLYRAVALVDLDVGSINGVSEGHESLREPPKGTSKRPVVKVDRDSCAVKDSSG
jgi:hypothetical protein